MAFYIFKDKEMVPAIKDPMTGLQKKEPVIENVEPQKQPEEAKPEKKK